jgi:hypothetical protein
MTLAINDVLSDCAESLLAKRNPANGGWGLNIERGSQSSSIVNTAESIFVLSSPLDSNYDLQPSIDYIAHNILLHGQDGPRDGSRQDCLRYLSFGILGLFWANQYKDLEQVKSSASKIRKRFKKDVGWSETKDDQPSIHSTYFACQALGAIHGWSHVKKRYGNFINSLVQNFERTANHDLLNISGLLSLSKLSYLSILESSISDSKFESCLHRSIAELLYNKVQKRSIIEHESVAGADWHHYSTCWAIKALLNEKVLDRDQYLPLVESALLQILSYWRPGQGILELDKNIVNVRSVFNPCVAMKAYLTCVGIRHSYSPRVFLVHGRKIAAVNRIELFLRRLGCDCIQLRLEPSKGRTIIEKFMEVTSEEVDFVVVLMTDDDIGKLKHTATEKSRARQNVILELGYFLNKLPRDRVAVICHKDLDIPSDLAGLNTLQFNSNVEESLPELSNELLALDLVKYQRIMSALRW